MDVNTQATTEPKDIGQILEDGRTQVAADVPAPAQEHQRDQSDASGPDDTERAGNDRRIPFATLHSERAKRKAAQERAAQLEAQLQEVMAAQQPVYEQQTRDEFWANPDQVLAHQRAESNYRVSKAEFKADYGKAAYDDLERTLEANQSHPDIPHLAMAMRQSDDPIGIARQWAEQALGWSPEGSQQKATPHYGMVMPSNLAGARNVGKRSGPEWAGRPSIGDILNSAHQPRDIFKR